jgi:mycothiol S-conjugate amidase
MGVEPPFGVDTAEALPFLTPDNRVTARIDCSAGLDRKRDALRAHRSQIAPDWPLLNVPDEIARQFADEEYSLVISRRPGAPLESDLFAGVEAGEPVAVG